MNKFKEVFCEILIFLREQEEKEKKKTKKKGKPPSKTLKPALQYIQSSFWTDCEIFIYFGAY